MLIILIGNTPILHSQPDTITRASIDAQVDIVSRYIWRGLECGQAPSIQPNLSVSWKNFTIGSWGAYKLTGSGNQETDLYLSKELGPLTFAIWDYWTFNDTANADFFNYRMSSTTHLLEAQVLYSGGDQLPFNLLGSYLFYGADPSNSIYLELQYLKSCGPVDLCLFAGFQATGTYYASGPAFVNLGFSGVKKIALTNRYSVPVNVSLIANPERKSLNLVAGITF